MIVVVGPWNFFRNVWPLALFSGALRSTLNLVEHPARSVHCGTALALAQFRSELTKEHAPFLQGTSAATGFLASFGPPTYWRQVPFADSAGQFLVGTLG